MTTTHDDDELGYALALSRDEAIHRFLVRPGDTGLVGFVDGGRLLEWIDKVAFEAAARWCAGTVSPPMSVVCIAASHTRRVSWSRCTAR